MASILIKLNKMKKFLIFILDDSFLAKELAAAHPGNNGCILLDAVVDLTQPCCTQIFKLVFRCCPKKKTFGSVKVSPPRISISL